MASPPRPGSSKATVVLIALAVIAVLGLFVVPFCWGIYTGVTTASNRHRGTRAAKKLAAHIAQCGVPLPPRSSPVPSKPPAGLYKSTWGDWTDPAFTCGGSQFSLSEPQLHRLQWERLDDEAGVVIGEADLDGDGEVDHRVEVGVTCSAGTCVVSKGREEDLRSR